MKKTAQIVRFGINITAVICLSFGCSTQKNTGLSRSWHELKIIHNVQFNGELAYNEGIDALNQAHTDNFSTVLPLYPVSDQTATQAAVSSMDKAIDKCRKSIKLHSIKARPKINPKKKNNAKYQNWLKNKEFNSQMYRAWLMLGQSEFHKGDFLGAIGTFRYIERLYENDPNMVALCQLWVARSYGELGWIYEAEDILSKVKIDDLKRKYEPFYSAVSADVLLKGQHYKEAIPYLLVARHDEKRKGYLPRFEYVLAQLYQLNHQTAEARSAYKRTYQLHPKDVNMDFNARLHYAELRGDTTKSMKQLRQMTRLYKYKDKLDQLYGVMGKICLTHQDTIRALQLFQKGIESSTAHGNEAGEILVIAGDLYYERNDFPMASPCYHEAAQILTPEHSAYKRVAHRSEILDDIVVHINMVQLQDSLQRLGHLSEDEQLKVVEKIIADLIEKERQDSIAQAEQARADELEAQSGGLQSVDLSKMVGNRTGEAANWYFYNPQLMKSGKQDFMQKWGNRALEDNWRRLSKSSVISATQNQNENEKGEAVADSLLAAGQDSTMNINLTSDIYSPQYYLQQIPKTEDDYAASNALVADAMYQLIYLYRDKVESVPLSEQTYKDFLLRFPDDERIVDLYYDQYLYALRFHHDSIAGIYRAQILEQFPQSAQAKIVSDPQYFTALQRMAQEQDSVYAATYEHYKNSQYAMVKQNKIYADTNYPLTPLMPRFLFLNSIAVAKTDGQEEFTKALRDLVQRYPENELSAMAKDMLAMMGQGLEAQEGGTTSTLTSQREENITESADTAILARSFSDERKEKSLVYIIIDEDEEFINNLLYEIALFNFSQFMIKDFDLRIISTFTTAKSALEIAGFETLEEAVWYIGLLETNSDLQQLLQQHNSIVVPITETNSQLINHPFSLDDYLQFYHQ